MYNIILFLTIDVTINLYYDSQLKIEQYNSTIIQYKLNFYYVNGKLFNTNKNYRIQKKTSGFQMNIIEYKIQKECYTIKMKMYTIQMDV